MPKGGKNTAKVNPKAVGKGKAGKGGKLNKAVKASKAHKKGVQKSNRKLRYTVHFKTKPTLKQARKPKYARKVWSN